MSHYRFAAALCASLALFSAGLSQADDKRFSLAAPLSTQAFTRVKVSMKVGGDLFLQSQKKSAPDMRPLPMSAEAELTYDEKVTQIGEAARAIRFYQQAEAKFKMEKGGETPRLADSRRLIAVQAGLQGVNFLSPNGPLTREELDLIDLPANSLLLGRLLPTNEVRVGDHWKHSDELLARLLGLDVISQSTAESTLASVAEGIARVSMQGGAQGAVDGVTAKLEFKAKYEVDLEAHRIVYFALLIKDKRPPGQVNPGLDVVAKLVMELAPLESSDELTEEQVSRQPDFESRESTLLVFRPVHGGYELPYERRWYVTGAERDLAILRLMDRGELIAQCNISPLPAATKSADGHMTLEQYQDQVKAALGERFGRFFSASESERPDKQGKLFCVVAEGEQAALQLRWIYYLITAPDGERVSVAFTLEEKLAVQFGAADAELVANLRMLEAEASEPRPAALQAVRESAPAER